MHNFFSPLPLLWPPFPLKEHCASSHVPGKTFNVQYLKGRGHIMLTITKCYVILFRVICYLPVYSLQKEIRKSELKPAFTKT